MADAPFTFVCHADADAFLARADAWLRLREAEHNLHLSLAAACRAGRYQDALLATVERAGAVQGCVIRTPPHKLLVTDMPVEAAEAVARGVSETFHAIPAVLGPDTVAEAIASAWARVRGCSYRRGMEQRLYRLEKVTPAQRVSGELRRATEDDVDVLVPWGVGFGDDVGPGFALLEDSIRRMIDRGDMYVWEVGRPVSMAVAQGDTGNGCRVGYVYTPPKLRGHGYASALVAALSQHKLDEGLLFCILYTDLSNATSNSIYQRVGYRPICDVIDFEIVGADD